MNIEFDEPDPALGFRLNEIIGDPFHSFSFISDSVYNELMNTPDSIELTLEIDAEYLFNLVLFNNTILHNPIEDTLIKVFSKVGYVSGVQNSNVYAHFTPDYFSFQILVDSTNYYIVPVRTYSESLKQYANSYIFTSEPALSNIYQSETACENYNIDFYIIADAAFLQKYNNDTGFIQENIELHLSQIEKWFNETWGNSPDQISIRAVFQIDSSINFNSNIEINRLYFIDRNKYLFPCQSFDLYIALTGKDHIGEGETIRSTICNSYGILPDNPDYPGISRLNHRDYIPFEFPMPGFPKIFTLNLMHELIHAFGSNHLSLEDCTGFDCPLMCENHCDVYNIGQSTFNLVKNSLEIQCEECFSVHSVSPECTHCEFTADFVVEATMPLISSCMYSDEVEITFKFKNNCDARSTKMIVSFDALQLQLIDNNVGDFAYLQSDADDRWLHSDLYSLDPEKEILLKARFILVPNPTNNDPINSALMGIQMQSNGSAFFTFGSGNTLTYIVPDQITGSYNLSQLIEPNSTLFNDENLSGCLVTNKSIRVDGVLSINSDYCINNSLIVMEEASKIVVRTGNILTLNKVRILGCELMWDALEVEEGASLVINESIIEDAMAAVRLEENTSLASSETKYHNNLYGVIAALNDPGDIELNILAGNSFTADDTLRKDPVAGSRAKAGIWLANVNEAYIQGEPPHIEPGMNIFSNLKNGIVLYSTDATVQNFHIYDIYDGPANIKEVDELPDGHGIYVNGSSGHFTTAIGSADTRDNYIHAQRGIFIKDANADIQYCNIRADLSAIILGYCNNREVNILNNLINAQYRGIQLRLPISVTANITNNRITMPTDNGIGIQALSSWKDVKIADNLIFLNGSREGISLTDCKSTYVEENRIIFENVGEHQMKGISMEASSGNIIFDNHVIGKNKNHNTVGIYTQDSPANTLLCNEVKMTNVCYQFAGISSLTNFHTNNHLTSDFGLLLGTEAIGSEAIIGEQIHKQNTWPLIDYGDAGAMLLTDDPDVINRSIFILDDSQYPYYPPNILDLIGINWFEDIAVDEYIFDCHNLPTEIPDICCNYSVPTNTVIDFDTYPEVKDLRLRKQLYQSLRDGLIDTSETLSLYQFYTLSDTTSYGKLVDVRQLFELASISSAGGKASSLSAALSKNNQIPDTEDYFLYETEANEILAEYIEDGDLSILIEAESDITDIATLCPYEFGDGVYMNRSWLRAIDLEAGFDEIDACGAIEPRSPMGESDSNLAISLNKCHIWPNPAHIREVINILSNQPITRVMITDIIGRKILEYQPTSKAELSFHFQIDQNGLYIITVWDETGERITCHQMVVN